MKFSTTVEYTENSYQEDTLPETRAPTVTTWDGEVREEDFVVEPTYFATLDCLIPRVGVSVKVTHTPTGEFEVSSGRGSSSANRNIAIEALIERLDEINLTTTKP